MYVFVLASAIAYIGICGFLYVQQRTLLYFPTPRVEMTEIKHIVLHNEEQSLKTWVLNEGKSRAIIYFGGNAEGVEANFASFQQMFPDYTVYLLNYRGYGGSSGEPNETALYKDALHLFDEIKVNHQSISVIGRSLGSGIATYLAAHRSVERLALVTPYDSIINVAQKAYPWAPISLLLQDRYESKSWAPNIKSKTLLIIAENDEIIPRESSEALAASFSTQQLSKTIITDHDHNSLSEDPEYTRVLSGFFR